MSANPKRGKGRFSIAAKKPGAPNGPSSGGPRSSTYAERFGSSGGGRTLASEQAAPRGSGSGGPPRAGTKAAFANSAGTNRLNRILHQNPTQRPSYVPNQRRPGAGRGGAGGASPAGGGPRGDAYSQRRHRSLAAGSAAQQKQQQQQQQQQQAEQEKTIDDPTDEKAVGEWVARLTQRLRVDPRSIGGQLLQEAKQADSGNAGKDEEDGPGNSNLLVRDDGTKKTAREKARERATGNAAGGGKKQSAHEALVSALGNECLYSARVSKFEITGGPSQPKKKHIPKSRNKLRYVCVVRTTNRALLKSRRKKADKEVVGMSMDEDDEDDDDIDAESDVDSVESEESAGYDTMFSPNEGGGAAKKSGGSGGKSKAKKKAAGNNKSKQSSAKTKKGELGSDDVAAEDEISSFPALVCMALHADGSNPDIRRVLMLDQLVGVESKLPQPGEAAGSNTSVILVFRTGDRVEIECGDSGPSAGPDGAPAAAGGSGGAGGDGAPMRREKFLWSLLQIHAILCTAVVERYGAAMLRGGSRARAAASSLPPLKTRNVDRTELQYASTANGFLGESPALVALLERQRNRGREGRREGEEKTGEEEGGGDGKGSGEEMDGLAYDMLMGNYNTRMALFVSEEEKHDAEEVLNSTPWYQDGEEKTDGGESGRQQDVATSAEALAQLLQKRMRDLEAETCRRLIAWEDEKQYSITGTVPDHVQRDTVDALSLAALFNTLDLLDVELGEMEDWLQERARIIKPLTDDCAGIEEENRQLEQQWKSYDALGQELRRLLAGLDVPSGLRKTLGNPGAVLQYDSEGNVDVKKSEKGIDEIYQAGRFLKDAIDRVENEGGVHLRAVSERIEKLASVANKFCTALAQIVVTVMEQLSSDVVAKTDFTKNSKGESHTIVAKRIRDAQRKFQSSLLGYIKLVEVLALLKPSILPAIRDAYSELVAEGILSKKRMKVYFASLPQRSSVSGSTVTKDLKEYNAVTLRSSKDDSGTTNPVSSQDIQKALAEILPVIAREAYFTAALFGLSSRHMDGREKKRNFESAKRSVDHSSQYFRYYMSRICGIASEVDAEGKKVSADPMLSLVSSIHLNEAMDSYIDRQKKGGDHSLSLAYVRATILEMRKKVDKQWVTWVEEEIKWIRTNAGVSLNGKRAGVFASFARFPAYLDHVLICCKADRPKDYSLNLHKIKVVSYYLQKMAGSLFASLHECAERETTDQQYAANVMRMENSYFFTQSIKQRGNEMSTLFQKQITAASAICKQSTDAYLGWMIKREFKSLHSLFSNISRIRRDVGDADVPIHVPRATFIRTLSKESSREVMKEKISIIYSRMEKHLSEQGGLLPVAWKALVKVLYEWFGRWEKLSSQCYKFILEPSAVDVVRIAKAAGGASRPKTSESRTLSSEVLPADTPKARPRRSSGIAES